MPSDIWSLRHLAHAAAARNETLGVTGLLLYSKPTVQMAGLFAQWIEGSPADVTDLYATICEDPRHDSVETLAQGALADLVGCDARLFPGWTMRHEVTRLIPTSLDRFLSDWLSQHAEADPVG